MTAMTQEEIVSSTKTVIQGLEALKSEHNQVIMALCGAQYKTHLIDSHHEFRLFLYTCCSLFIIKTRFTGYFHVVLGRYWPV